MHPYFALESRSSFTGKPQVKIAINLVRQPTNIRSEDHY